MRRLIALAGILLIASGVCWAQMGTGPFGDNSSSSSSSGTAAGWTSDSSTKTTSTYNVGIGSASPRSGLDVNGTGYFTSVYTGSGTGSFKADSGFGFIPDENGANTTKVTITEAGNVGMGTTTTTSQLTVEQTASADAFRVNDAAADTTPFLIDETGNVGIGTSVPAAMVDFKPVASGTVTLIRGNDADVGHNITGILPTNTFFELRESNSTGGGLFIRGFTDEGTSTIPATLLGIFGANSVTDTMPALQFRCGMRDGGTSTNDMAQADTCFQISGDDGDPDYFTVMAGAAGQGNVGIGTVTPLSRLSVVGTGATAATNSLTIMDSALAVKFRINDAGNVGIGTTAPEGPLIIRASTNDIGWKIVDGADNTACNTICTSSCVHGFQNATGAAVTSPVNCDDATADQCLCSGAD